jgi:NADH pyrophosphatase NudC (nudix superfamily)
MELAAILFILAILLAVAMYLAAPLMANRSPRVVQETQEVSSLLAERERLLTALQELDFDYQLGKIPEEDYPVQRADLLQKGVGVLKQLDALASSRPSHARPIEQGISPEQGGQLSDDDIESMLAARRKARKTKSAGFCPRCGKPVLVTDQFCPSCGKALQ